MNTNNLIINRARKAWMRNKTTGDLIFYLLDVKEPSLEITGEQVFATDGVGQKIAAFDRNKEAKLNCQSSIYDLNLFAAQVGSEKKEAAKDTTILAPVVDILEAKEGKITLSKTPATGYSITAIYLLNNDGSQKQKFEAGSEASETAFVINGQEITLPTVEEASKASRWLVMYSADFESGVSITADAGNVAASGEFTLEVLFSDPCDTTTEYFGYVIFPNAKLTNEVTLEMNTEAGQQFVVEAMLDWCSLDKKLFEMVVVE